VQVSSSTSRRSRTGRRADARDSFPGFVDTQLATLRAGVPEGEDWIHEIKYDGYRTQAHLRDGRAALFTRRGYDWTDQFRRIAEAVEALDADELILDGEVIVQDERGVPDFAALQSEIARRCSDRLTFCLFDLLYLDGKDLRRLPLIERKQRLAELVEGREGAIVYSAHLEAEGVVMFEQARRMRLEGVISKLKASPCLGSDRELGQDQVQQARCLPHHCLRGKARGQAQADCLTLSRPLARQAPALCRQGTQRLGIAREVRAG
jgi:bifunctional non-homologous end joining protein LigD